MNAKNTVYSLLVLLLVGTVGCARMQPSTDEAAGSGETKVRLDQTPAPVRQTIERELVGARLEDIAMEKRQGKTVYETDIIRDGHKWEVLIAEDGQILHKIQEGKGADEQSESQGAAKADQPGWRDTFDVNKAALRRPETIPTSPSSPDAS